MIVKGAIGSGSGGRYALLVHGGAGDSHGVQLDGQIEACRLAATAGKALLEAGAPALDAVQRAVALEDDPRVNSATGGSLTSAGMLELDASIMRGEDLAAGAVCSLPPFAHPIAIARAVLEDGKHVLYAGLGASEFAQRHGFSLAEPASMITDEARAALARFLAKETPAGTLGTVGAVAVDLQGHLAAATSTGGITGKQPGRVGDSPIIGAGTYADDALGAASATGMGEAILRVSLCHRTLSLLARSGESPAQAAFDNLRYMHDRTGAVGGLIVVGRDGQLGWARSTKSMPYAATWAKHGVMTGG